MIRIEFAIVKYEKVPWEAIHKNFCFKAKEMKGSLTTLFKLFRSQEDVE